MADIEKHIINRVNASISCSKHDLNSVQKLGLASYITGSLEDILPLLDAKFGKKIVRLEELSITLDINTDQLPNFSDLLKKALKEALLNVGKKNHVLSKATHKERGKLEPHQVFLYFLKNGQMPWFSADLKHREAYFSDPNFKVQCLAVLKESPSARERLVQQFTKEELFSVLTSLYPTKFIKSLFDFTHFVIENTHRYSERYAAGFRLGQYLLSSGLSYLQKGDGSYGLHDFLSQRSYEIVAELKKECNGKHLLFIESIQEKLAKTYHVEIDFDTTSADLLVPTKKLPSPSERISEQQIWAGAKKEDQQLVLNAGIILLHPFIGRFFKKVGLVENNRFISLAHQQRGICLLHNLATGEVVFPEEKLLFYKFLCNYPLEQPIPKELPISDFELEEVQQVLHSAIEHWTALKRTSIDGLRMNFLQRKGLLEKDALGYTLHVESQTADILLDQLPWGLSAAHWSWLPHLLTIKWR